MRSGHTDDSDRPDQGSKATPWRTRCFRIGTVAAVLAVSGALLTFGVWAFAQSTVSAVPRLVPYQGNLERNGAVVDVPADMVFSLYTSASGGSALWREAHGDVPV